LEPLHFGKYGKYLGPGIAIPFSWRDTILQMSIATLQFQNTWVFFSSNPEVLD